MKIVNNLKMFFIMIIGLILGLSVINVKAMVPNSIKLKPTSSLYYFTEKKKTDYINGYNFYRKELTDGTLAYCSSNISSHVPAGKTMYLKGEVTDKGLSYIILNGYPNKTFTDSPLKDYYITQAAVWRYFDETRGSKNWNNSTFTSTSKGMKRLVYDLVQAAKVASAINVDSSISASIGSNTMQLKENVFESNPISVSLINTSNSYIVSLEGEPEGTYVKGLNGEIKNTFSSDEKFIVVTPVTNISGTIKIKISATGSVKKVYEYTTKNSYYQDVIVAIPYEEEIVVNKTLDINFKLNRK